MMKNTFHKIGAVFLMAICAMPALAQLSDGSRYYRVRNAESGKYLAITNDKFSCDSCIRISGSASNAANNPTKSIACANAFLRSDIKIVDDPGSIIPGSIIYAKQRNTSTTGKKQYNLIAQGTSLLTLTTGQYFGDAVQPTISNIYALIEPLGNNMYNASIELKASLYGLMNYSLGVRYLQDDNGTLAIVESNSLLSTKWYFEPISQLNVEPDVAYNGKYYTTMYVHFPFVLGSSMKAYYITGVTNDGTLSYYTYSSGSTIPAATPVILECSSPNAAENILQLTSTEPEFTDPVSSARTAPAAQQPINPSTNQLKGTYYCNTDGDVKVYTYTLHLNKYKAATNPQKYILGINSSGKFGFIEATTANTNNGYMPANKAWMEQGGVFPIVATPTITPVTGSYNAAQTVTIACTDAEATIYYTTDGSSPTTNSTQYTGSFVVNETSTVKAIAVKEGLYNNSDVATESITILQPELAADPALLTIDDNGNYAFYVTGSNLSDNVGVTRTNSGFTPNLSATTGTPVNNNSTYDNGPYWYFTPDNHSLSGQVNVTYDGRALMASDDLTVGTRNAAGTTISTTVHVDYVPDIFIVGDNGTGNWNYANGTQMAEDNGIYTAAVTVPANCCILFARKTGVNYTWDYDYNRIFFGAETNGANWLYNGTNHQGNLELDPRDNNHIKYCPIQFQDAGNYIITVNATNNTFTITGITGSTLAQIEANGTVGNTYAVSDELTGAWYVKYTDENHVVHPLLFAKDQGNANVKTYKDEATGQIDYVKEILGWQDNDWDQSSWVILDFKNVPNGETEAQNLVDHKITPSSIIGTYTDNSNYTIELTGTAPTANGSQLNQYLGYMGPVSGENPYGSPYQGAIYNTYVTPNFLTTNLNVGQNSGFVATSGPHAGDHLFFVNPKVMEVALVYGVWAGNDVFTVYQPNYDNPEIPTSSVVNAWGTVGSVTANWKYNRNSDSEISYGKPEGIDEHVNDAYFLHALIGRKASNTLRSQGTADGSQVSSEYEIYPLDMPTRAGNWTKVDEVNVLRTVQSVRYYNVMGMESEKPFEGINIVVTRYSDGTTSATKILR